MFVNLSFLPDKKVSHVIVDKSAPKEFLENLQKLKITPVLSADNMAVSPSLSTHPDMQIFHCGGNTVVCEPCVYDYYARKLSPFGFNIICGNTRLTSNYPTDIAYNVASIGNVAFHKISNTDENILSILTKKHIRIINVAQGYTKCATCIVGKNAVITSDSGIEKALGKLDVEVLKIRPGGIELAGMNYGFIGGACGLLAPNLLAFCGNVEKHLDYKNMKAFAQNHGVYLVSLCSGGLIDIGSIIPIKQEVIDWKVSQ
ncbi:MAG: hypothetical protein M0R40_03395 [Firmicutes bacterium]|nr:hypothetical protein [Bacillota bacterium]